MPVFNPLDKRLQRLFDLIALPALGWRLQLVEPTQIADVQGIQIGSLSLLFAPAQKPFEVNAIPVKLPFAKAQAPSTEETSHPKGSRLSRRTQWPVRGIPGVVRVVGIGRIFESR